MLCPYCQIDVAESAIEAEDGHCPECGNYISAISIMREHAESKKGRYDEFEEDFDEMEMDDDDIVEDIDPEALQHENDEVDDFDYDEIDDDLAKEGV